MNNRHVIIAITLNAISHCIALHCAAPYIGIAERGSQPPTQKSCSQRAPHTQTHFQHGLCICTRTYAVRFGFLLSPPDILRTEPSRCKAEISALCVCVSLTCSHRFHIGRMSAGTCRPSRCLAGPAERWTCPNSIPRTTGTLRCVSDDCSAATTIIIEYLFEQSRSGARLWNGMGSVCVCMSRSSTTNLIRSVDSGHIYLPDAIT